VIEVTTSSQPTNGSSEFVADVLVANLDKWPNPADAAPRLLFFARLVSEMRV
jgi:hypothetical protein